MKIGEWDDIGRARGLIVHQLGQLGADELAAHVALNPDTGRQRILVATDIGLLDYVWSAESPQPDARWSLRGNLVRWPSVRGLRLQTDAQFDPVSEDARAIWRLVAEDPKIELSAGGGQAGDPSLPALLAFGRACLERSGA
ncbi:MAG: hypothetical protein ACRDGV_07290 [Candidatus Limnocylindria bacterium]